jgi:hypothetical protein
MTDYLDLMPKDVLDMINKQVNWIKNKTKRKISPKVSTSVLKLSISFAISFCKKIRMILTILIKNKKVKKNCIHFPQIYDCF